MPDEAQTVPEFEIGLVMAGAVSAGAYSAGVVDFLVEALDAYEYARTNGKTAEGEPWTGPTHSVRVPVLSGASAGGMTAAITALQIHSDFEHMGPGLKPSSPEKNRLYASWVDEIGLQALLEQRDLVPNQNLKSVLCSTVLEEIVARTLQVPKNRSRAWVGRNGSNALSVLFTVSNTGGIPYQFRLRGSGHDGNYTMLNHGDDLRFVVGRSPELLAEHEGFLKLDLESTDPATLELFGTAALATGAFPIGLSARPVKRAFKEYFNDGRVGSDFINAKGELEFMPVQPIKTDRVGDLSFVAVDGGVIDNEPFELARRFLAKQLSQNPTNQNGIETRYAVILVDPFPNRANWPQDNVNDLLLTVVPSLVSMLINQARFKPQELALALNESVFSRFAILPEPINRSAKALGLPIACGALGGFSGFLDRSFRHHDYCLGRRNAQAFLRWHFCLPENNPLFAQWKNAGGDTAAWYVENSENLGSGEIKVVDERVTDQEGQCAHKRPALPIIPLTPYMLREITLASADMPQPGQVDKKAFAKLLDSRFSAVVKQLVDNEVSRLVPGGFLGRSALKMFLPGVMSRKAVEAIDQALGQIHDAFPPGG